MPGVFIIADQNYSDVRLATEIIAQLDRRIVVEHYYNSRDLLARLTSPKVLTIPILLLLEYDLPPGGAAEIVNGLAAAGKAGLTKIAIWGPETADHYRELCVRWEVEECFSKKGATSELKKMFREIIQSGVGGSMG